MNLGTVLTLLVTLLLVNTIGAIFTVFRTPRTITSVLAWLLTLIFLPGIGFLIYAFCGRGLDKETKKKLRQRDEPELAKLEKIVKADNDTIPTERPDRLLIREDILQRYLHNATGYPLTQRNDLQIFTDGHEKFEALFADIRQAKETIHVEYYSFFNDRIGTRFLKLLEEKLRQGLEVRLIYDPWGSPGADKKFFAEFVALGGKVTPFVTSKNLIMKTRLNYHLHRKIVVIDGKIGWTGGFNVGDQYLGENERFGYWRDSHARIIGVATFELQAIFIMDWNASVARDADQIGYEERFFTLPSPDDTHELALQVIPDGPDSSEEIIKRGFIRMILMAEKSVWMQTPYLIPDDSMLNALLIAVRSGVDVRIMIPCKPDHPFIYRATQYYANLLHQAGAKIYMYDNGFLHAKTMVVDQEICTIGSTNQDIRSYALNFEVSTFIYDEEVSKQFVKIFEKDMLQCTLLTDEMIDSRSRWLRFKQNFSRLLSPIL